MVQVGVIGLICTTVPIAYVLSACEMQSKAMSNVYLSSISQPTETCSSFSFFQLILCSGFCGWVD